MNRMRSRRSVCIVVLRLSGLLAAGALRASSRPGRRGGPPSRRSASSRSARPTPNFKPDYSKLPPELQKTFAYIDEHIDRARREPAEVAAAAEHLEPR